MAMASLIWRRRTGIPVQFQFCWEQAQAHLEQRPILPRAAYQSQSRWVISTAMASLIWRLQTLAIVAATQCRFCWERGQAHLEQRPIFLRAAFHLRLRWVISMAMANLIWRWQMSLAIQPRCYWEREQAHLERKQTLAQATFQSQSRWVISMTMAS